MTEFWTEVRLLMYPVLLVLGATWGMLFWFQYGRTRQRCQVWSAWLGASVAALGAAGFGSLVVARMLGGFSSVTSGVLTLGLLVIVVVLVAGVLATGVTMWRSRITDFVDGTDGTDGTD